MRIESEHRDTKPSTVGEALLFYGLIGLMGALLVLEVVLNYEPRKLTAVLFILWWMPLVLLHEFGHALAAYMLGWRIERTVIGFGRVRYQRRLFGAPLELRSIPIEGFVQFRPNTSNSPRWQYAFTYFAGPGIELLLFTTILLTLGWNNFFLIEDDYLKLAWQSLAYAALIGAVINLIPMGTLTKEGTIPNDGLGILISFFGERPSE